MATPRSLLALSAVVLLGGCFDSSDGDSSWASPDCDRVTGTALVTFSKDRGETLVPTDEGELPVGAFPSERAGVTQFLQLRETGGAMVSSSPDEVMQVSHDSGCSWVPNDEGTALPDAPSLVGTGQTAGQYVFGVSPSDGQSRRVYRVSLEGEREDVLSVSDAFQMATTDADPKSVFLTKPDPESDGYVIRRGADEGMNWTEEGDLPPKDWPVLGINPHDALHFGAGGEGRFFRSFDGGVTWQEGGSYADEDASSTALRSVNFGGTEGSGEVWLAVNHNYSEGHLDSVIYYSNDNGETFSEIHRETRLNRWGSVGDAVMTARAGTAGELYFTFRGCAMYRYRVEDDSLKEYTWDDREDIGVSGIMAHPTDPDVIYVANGYKEGC